ncbi:FAD-dependent oxidoreductase [Nucisporomicrobium flavum]|uniref:FAD-dependent oxidoreductase n=1 Tax=Nucisporomicrobium flavum TaxID=2785915 RepID=UPI003C2EB050
MPEMPQVLVVGAGPVGLTTTHELVRRGVRVRLVDAADGPAVTSRAVATHPRTLELYDQMGVIDEILRRGREISAFTLYQDGRRLARLDADYSTMPTRYPFTVAIEQTSTEAIFRDALNAYGVTPEWGVRLEGLEQTDSAATVRLRHADGRVEETTVPWVVGCDGGHSTVRKMLDLPLSGAANQTWLLADAVMTTKLPPNSIYWIRTKGGTLMAVPLSGDRWRLLDTVEVDYDGDDDRIAQRFQRKISAGIGHRVTVERPTWVSVFTAQQRMVPRMRSGRCLVAGDAAHVHSPASGQGMNTGVQEAINLSWKLAMVIAGDSRPELLDTYEVERVPVGAALLESTKKATQMIEMRTPFTDLALPVLFGVISRVRQIRKKVQAELLGGMSGLNLSYRESPLSAPGGPSDDGPAPGQRITRATREDERSCGWPVLLEALREPRWLLLLSPKADNAQAMDVAKRAEDVYRRWLSVWWITDEATVEGFGVIPDQDRRVRDRLGLRDGGWVLVRPDGYVQSRGATLASDTLAAALERVCLVSPFSSVG